MGVKHAVGMLLIAALAAYVTTRANADTDGCRTEVARGDRTTAAETIAACKDWVEKVGDSPEDLYTIYVFRGGAYLETKDFIRALSDFEKAARLRPSHPGPFFLFGQLYLDQGQFTLAIENFSKAIVMQPSHVEALLGRGFAYVSLDQPDRGIQDFEQAALSRPGYWRTFHNLGFAYLKKDNCDKALEYFRQSVRLDPSGNEGSYFIAMCQSRKGDLKDALWNIDQAIAAKPTLRGYVLRAEINEKMGHNTQAIEAYDKALEISVRNRTALHNRCRLRAQAGQLEGAMADCNAVLSQVPDSASILETRAYVFFRLGDFAAAIKDCDKALTIYPQQAASKYLRGAAKSRLGDPAAKAEIATAEAAYPGIGKWFASLGVTP